MLQFMESLESRRLLSAITLASAEANLTSDVGTLISDARQAKAALVADTKAFATDLKDLHLQNGPLKSKLQTAVASARTTIQNDVTHIISSGFKDGEAVVRDVLNIYFADAGDSAKIMKDQTRLAADVTVLRNVETPLIDKLGTDVSNAQSQIGAAVQSILTANPSDQALATSWSTLSGAYESFKQTLVADFTAVSNDLDALSTAT